MSIKPFGKLFVIEGCDGCGKTSVIDFLKISLPKEIFLFTREPGGGGNPLTEKIRGLILDPLLKDADPNFTGDDTREGMTAIV